MPNHFSGSLDFFVVFVFSLVSSDAGLDSSVFDVVFGSSSCLDSGAVGVTCSESSFDSWASSFLDASSEASTFSSEGSDLWTEKCGTSLVCPSETRLLVVSIIHVFQGHTLFGIA